MASTDSTIITFDLSSLGLPTGTYSIHVKLNGDGYRDSDASNIVEYTVGGSSVSLISFTIDGTSYQAEEGMTWEQWANSSYNTAGAYATGLNYSINGKWIADARNGGAVLHQDAIKANREYFLKDHTGGGGND